MKDHIPVMMLAGMFAAASLFTCSNGDRGTEVLPGSVDAGHDASGSGGRAVLEGGGAGSAGKVSHGGSGASAGHAGVAGAAGATGTGGSGETDAGVPPDAVDDAPVCNPPQTWCSGACVSTDTDRLNCGTCGHACARSLSCVNGACACAAGPFVVYVSKSGNEANFGEDLAHAVPTLKRAHDVVRDSAPPCDVEVRIDQTAGTYVGQTVSWTYTNPNHTIKLMPANYKDGDGIGDIGSRPVFDGSCQQKFLLDLVAKGGKATNFQVIYLWIQNYQTYGIRFAGNQDDFASGWNGSNYVFGCYFWRIGTMFCPGAGKCDPAHGFNDCGYGALDLVNSRQNIVRNNWFVKNENNPADSSKVAYMHGVYMAHGSSDNQIDHNQFQTVSGDPIKVRDGCDRNRVEQNTFTRTGVSADFVDSWCDPQKDTCTKSTQECPSWQNVFQGNTRHASYPDPNLYIPACSLYNGDTVPAGCVNHNPDGWKRVDCQPD
jgi:hypothetical protein